MAVFQAQVTGYRCDQCGHEWIPGDWRGMELPRRCASCKSRRWNAGTSSTAIGTQSAVSGTSSTTPFWIELLAEIEGFEIDESKDQRLARWVEGKGISQDHAESVINRMLSVLSYDGNGRWEYRDVKGKSRSYTDLRATFRNWVSRGRNGYEPREVDSAFTKYE